MNAIQQASVERALALLETLAPSSTDDLTTLVEIEQLLKAVLALETKRPDPQLPS